MTVSSQTSNETFFGNGVTVSWPLPFRFFNNSDVQVFRIDTSTNPSTVTPLSIGTDYTLTGAGLPEQFGTAPGVITTKMPIATGSQLYVERVMPIEQLTDIINQGEFFPEVHEDVFDRLTMLIQQFDSGLGRALLRPRGADYYDALGYRIANLGDPVLPQDAATYKSVGDLISQVQGPINNSANVFYQFPDGTPHVAQDLSSGIGTSGIGGPRGTLEQDLLGLIDRDKDLSQSLWQTVQNAGQIGDLTAVAKAVARRTLRITVVGDSILEGVSQILYQDSAIGIWMRLLLEQNPGLTVIVSNYSIPGQALGNLADPNYKGVDFGQPGGFWMPPSGPIENRWPGGSVVGKSWWNHIRDSTPDLIVFGFGMNHVAGGSPPLDYNANIRFDAIYYKALTAEAAAWAVAPSFALVSSMLPTNDPEPDSGVWPHFRKQVQDSASAVRGLCAEMDWTCIDVNRWWVFHSDATDMGLMTYRRNPAIGEYPAGWTTTTGSFNVIAADAISGIGSITNNVKCTDLYARAYFQLGDDTQVGSIFYRDYGNIVGGQRNRYEAIVLKTGGTWYLNVYWQGVTMTSTPLTTILTQDFLLEVHVEGCHHRFYVDSVLIFDTWHYGNVSVGSHGLFVSGGSAPASVSATIFRQGNEPKLGEPHYSEQDMLGLGQAEWAANPDSLGGGKLNHPSKLGVKLAYVPGFAPITEAIRRLSENSADHVHALSQSSSFDFYTGWNSSNVVIDDVIGSYAFPQGAAGADRILSVSSQRAVAGGRDVTVYALWNGTRRDLPTTITLPPGRWNIAATYTAARQHANNSQLHQLLIEATKI